MPEEPTPTPSEGTPTPTDPASAPPKPGDPAPTPTPAPAKKSLEDNLAALDDDARQFVMGEVTKARGEAKNLRDRLKAAEPKISEYDRLAEASKTELERSQETATRSGQKAAKWQQRAVKAEVKSLAKGFADAEDAVVHLAEKLAGYAGEDDEIDTEAIKTDLSDLLARKPHLGAVGDRTPRPNPAQGSGGSGGAPASQLTKEDVARLAEEGKNDEIVKARSEGRLDHIMGKTH